jgi:hypothetical protein
MLFRIESVPTTANKREIRKVLNFKPKNEEGTK